jgi:cellulose synthase/poly-beta-1,6-N-acetylglucosamine synthase-like glycosyltransferase
VQLTGVELQFVPDALVHIRFPDTLSSLYRQARGYAEYNTLLQKKYQSLGMPKLSWKDSLQRWVYICKITRGIYTKRGRAALAWQLGAALGRLQGSIKHHIWAL